MTKSEFIYTTYIRTTPEKLWHALTTPEFIKQYWFGVDCTCEWKKGSSWQLSFADGQVADSGEILESNPPKRLVIKWRNEWKEELKDEGYSNCAFDIEQEGTAVKLTVTHTIDKESSKLITSVSGGWPKVLSNLKSLLETGEVTMLTHTGCK